MAPDTPEPEAPRPGSEGADGDKRPPRILVEVSDLHDPAEWDVILVENQDIDDDTARRIAAERAGRRPPPPSRPRGPRAPAGPTMSLPSLDEHDVMRAIDDDRDAEDVEDIDDDAFARPDDGTPLRRRAVIDLPPDVGAFADHPEPGDEPEEAAEPEAVDEPEAEAAEPEAEAEAPAVDAWAPAEREAPALLDDPDDDFYGIGAEAPEAPEPAPPEDAAAEGADHAAVVEPSVGAEADAEAAAPDEHVVAAASDDDAGPDGDHEPDDDADEEPEAEGGDPADHDGGADAALGEAEGEGEAGVEPGAWDLTAVALDEERDLIDDPEDPFYSVGRSRISAFGAARPPVPARTAHAPLPAPTDRLGSDLWGTAPPKDDAVFEDELEIDSSFPLGPDDLVPGGEVDQVALDELDYANVFGPVTGSLSVPDLDAPPEEARSRRRRPKPTYDDSDLYVFEDDDRHRPVPPPRSGGRRRELVVLGLAAGIIVALGVGSQVLRPKHDGGSASAPSSTTTTRHRATSSESTVPNLNLPTLPADPADGATTTVDPGGSTATTARRGSTTTVKGRSTTTTTAPRNTTTTAAPQTTTTAPPQTTTTAAPTTTEAPPTTTGDGP
jgi:hypothetical protein